MTFVCWKTSRRWHNIEKDAWLKHRLGGKYDSVVGEGTEEEYDTGKTNCGAPKPQVHNCEWDLLMRAVTALLLWNKCSYSIPMLCLCVHVCVSAHLTPDFSKTARATNPADSKALSQHCWLLRQTFKSILLLCFAKTSPMIIYHHKINHVWCSPQRWDNVELHVATASFQKCLRRQMWLVISLNCCQWQHNIFSCDDGQGRMACLLRRGKQSCRWRATRLPYEPFLDCALVNNYIFYWKPYLS